MPASRPSHDGLKQSRAERSGAASSFGQPARKTATQTIKPANQGDQRRQAGHALVHCHGHTHANSWNMKPHTQKGHRGRYYNYVDHIHLMMTFPQTQTWEIIHRNAINNSPVPHPNAQTLMCNYTGNVSTLIKYRLLVFPELPLPSVWSSLGSLSIDLTHFLASFLHLWANRCNNDRGSDCVSVCVLLFPFLSQTL